MDPTVAALQEELKRQGFYAGKIDGNMGAATQRAVEARDARQAAERSSQMQGQQLEAQKLEAEARRAETERLAREAQAAEAKKAAGETPYEQGRQVAMNTAPLAAGYYAGHKGADYLDGRFKEAAGYRADQLGKLAAASDDLDPRAVARTSDKLGLGQTRRGGLASYLVPATLGGMGAGVRFVGADHVPNEVGQDVARAFGSAEMGAGMGMLGQMLLQDVSSTPSINAVDLAKIEQARLAAKGKPSMTPYAASPAPQAPAAPLTPAPSSPASTPALAAPEAKPAAPGSRAYMVEQAKALEIKGATGMKKGELAKAISGAMGEHGAKRTFGKRVSEAAGTLAKSKAVMPVAAGAMAYDAMRSPSQAEDGSQMDGYGVPAALATGAAAGGATAGIPYVLSKAPGLLARTLGRVAGPVGAGMAAYDLGSMAVNENAQPDALAQGMPQQGAFPAAPGNPDFMQRQSRLAQMLLGQGQ